MLKVLLISMLIGLSSCISGDKLDSKLKYLNGDSYQKKTHILAVPILKTKDQEVKKKKNRKDFCSIYKT